MKRSAMTRIVWVMAGIVGVSMGVTAAGPRSQRPGRSTREVASPAAVVPPVPETQVEDPFWSYSPKYIPGWTSVAPALRKPSRRFTEPPAEPVRWRAEFEPAKGTLMAWPLYWRDVQEAFVAMVAELQEVGDVYMMYDAPWEQNLILRRLLNAGVTPYGVIWVKFPWKLGERIEFIDNCNWTRDYGPENIFGLQSGDWSIVDNRYYWDRRKENDANEVLGEYLYAGYYETPLATEGGNMAPDGVGTLFCTEWIFEENRFHTDDEVRQIFREYYGAELVVFPRLPISPHLDMGSKLIDAETWIIGQWPADDPNTAPVEEMVAKLRGMTAPTGRPYTIYRIWQPDRRPNGYWRTYTNAYMHNGKILVPIFGVAEDAGALAVYRRAAPGWDVVGIRCEGFDGSGGAIHCSTHEISGHGARLLQALTE